MVQQTYQVNETMDVELVGNGDRPLKCPPSRSRQSCWSRRTPLEKILLVALILLTAFAIALVLLMVLLVAKTGSDTATEQNDTGQASTLKDDEASNATCNSRECVRAAYRILENMDPRADPCDNFHEYACGGWVKRNTATDKVSYSIFSNELVHQVDTHLKTLLEMEEPPLDELPAFQKTRQFYSSCMLDSTIRMRGFQPAKALLDTLGKIHDNDTWTAAAENLTELVYRLLLKNGAPFFDVTLEVSSQDASQNVILVQESVIYAPVDTIKSDTNMTIVQLKEAVLDRSVWKQLAHGIAEFDVTERIASTLCDIHVEISLPTQSEIIQSYRRQEEERRKIVRRMLQSTGSSKVTDSIMDTNTTSDDTSEGEFFELLGKLNVTLDGTLLYRNIKISIDHKADEKMKTMLRAYFDRPATNSIQEAIESELDLFVTDLREIVPFPRELRRAEHRDETHQTFTLATLQRKMNQIEWKDLFRKLFGRTFNDSEMVEVEYPPYIEALQKLFQKYAPRVVNNAALALFARDVLWEISQIDEEMGDRWEFCIEATKKVLPIILSAMYVRDFDKDDLRNMQNDVKGMFEQFKRSFVQRIEQNDWLDRDSKERAKIKVEGMTGFLVHSDILYNDTVIENSAKNITILEHRFFENVINGYVQSRKESYDTSVSYSNEENIEMHALASPFVVNAYYLPSFNKIVLTLAILTPPHYSPDQPKFVTFANLGNTLGHEIMHGFDSTGIKYNSKGQKKPWLTNSSQQRFDVQTKCLSEIYSNTFHQVVEFLDQKVTIQFDGNFTLDENLADVSGIHLAYQAYQTWIEEHGQEMVLPGLQLTRQQLFFLSAAQSSCTIMSQMGYIFSLEMDDHTPEPDRINMLLMNSKSFAEAFHCPVGSQMNPKTKCQVW